MSSLGGLSVVVTRPRTQGSRFVQLLEREGARPIAMPTIAIADPSSWEPLDASVRRLLQGEYDIVVFPSANSARKTIGRIQTIAADATIPKGTVVAAVGRETGRTLSELGIGVDLIPSDFTADALVQALGRGDQRRLLLPRVEEGPPDIVRSLAAANWDVDEVAAYRNTLPDGAFVPDEVRRGDFDAVTFASPSAARNFAELVADLRSLGLAADLRGGPVVACIGPETARGARDAGLRVDIVAADHTSSGLVAALKDHFVNRREVGDGMEREASDYEKEAEEARSAPGEGSGQDDRAKGSEESETDRAEK